MSLNRDIQLLRYQVPQRSSQQFLPHTRRCPCRPLRRLHSHPHMCSRTNHQCRYTWRTPTDRCLEKEMSCNVVRTYDWTTLNGMCCSAVSMCCSVVLMCCSVVLMCCSVVLMCCSVVLIAKWNVILYSLSYVEKSCFIIVLIVAYCNLSGLIAYILLHSAVSNHIRFNCTTF